MGLLGLGLRLLPLRASAFVFVLPFGCLGASPDFCLRRYSFPFLSLAGCMIEWLSSFLSYSMNDDGFISNITLKKKMHTRFPDQSPLVRTPPMVDFPLVWPPFI